MAGGPGYTGRGAWRWSSGGASGLGPLGLPAPGDALHLPRLSPEGLELQVNECETGERENHAETLPSTHTISSS